MSPMKWRWSDIYMLFYIPLVVLTVMKPLALHTSHPKLVHSQGYHTIIFYSLYVKNIVYRDNIIYFLKKAINDEAYYVIICKGVALDVQPYLQSLAHKKNIHILYTSNIGFDFGAYAFALERVNITWHTFFIFLNSSVRGPFLPSYIHENWITSFTKMINRETKLVGTTINTMQSCYQVAIPHVQSMLFAMDLTALKFLKSKNMFRFHLKNKDMKLAILEGEIKMSRLILENGWNLNCLVREMRGLDYRYLLQHPNVSSNPTARCGDPLYLNALFGRTLHPYESVFVKTSRLNSITEQSLSKAHYNT